LGLQIRIEPLKVVRMSKTLFHGIIPPLITPLKDRDKLDVEGLERLIEHVIEGGVHGLFALGSNGEGPSLSYRLREEVIRAVCRSAVGRLPILISITDTSYTESIRLARIAEQSGATGVVLGIPYYYPLDQQDLLRYVERIIGDVSLPVVLYNIPALTKVAFEIETLEALAQHNGIVGVKDSSDDLDYFRKACAISSVRPDWSFFMGPEDKLIDSIALGGHGGVNGGANIYPRLFVEAYHSALNGDDLRRAEKRREIEALGAIYRHCARPSHNIKAIKCAVSVLGLCKDYMAEPFELVYPSDRAEVEVTIRALGYSKV